MDVLCVMHRNLQVLEVFFLKHMCLSPVNSVSVFSGTLLLFLLPVGA